MGQAPADTSQNFFTTFPTKEPPQDNDVGLPE